jgi:hypothetical protein
VWLLAQFILITIFLLFCTFKGYKFALNLHTFLEEASSGISYLKVRDEIGRVCSTYIINEKYLQNTDRYNQIGGAHFEEVPT